MEYIVGFFILFIEYFAGCSSSAAYYYFMPSIDAVPPTPAPSPLRTIYYPVRTNCQNQCYSQNRYRWIYRPGGRGGSVPYAPAPAVPAPYIQPSLSSQIGKPSQPPSSVTVAANTKKSPSQSSTYQPLELPLSPEAPLVPLPSSVITMSPSSESPPTLKPVAILIHPEPKRTSTTTYSPMVSHGFTAEIGPDVGQPNDGGLPTPPPYTQISQNVPFKRQNPCANGKPLTNELKIPVTCNFIVQPNGGCPENYWCHTGPSFETTTCCPSYNLKERCNLPKTSGEGEDLIPRWYYDISARKCKRFLYKGLKGNANNFITSIQCMETCETADRAAAYKNPCASGPPARNLDGVLFTCGPYASASDDVYDSSSTVLGDSNKAQNGEKCPAGYFCHVGESVETTACCELSSVRDSCLLSLNEGEGNANLVRFFYDISTKKCTEFNYEGIRGNENNFLTRDECKAACMKYNNPCPVLFDHDKLKFCSANGPDVCDKHEWCHIGSNADTTACCPGAVRDPCKLPLDMGHGSENLTRWYADSTSDPAGPCDRECRPFDYRGTKGNQNNFLSKEQCELACKPECFNPCSSGDLFINTETGLPQTCNSSSSCPENYWCHLGASPQTTVCCSSVKRACSLPLAEGIGQAVLSRWYYNKRDQTCKKFVYRGVGGNQNSYVTKDECLDACPAYDNPCGGGGNPLLVASRPKVCSPEHRCPSTHFCHIGSEEMPNYCCPKNGDPCDQPVSSGHGPHTIRRYHFDRDTRQCREFSYKGAKGNANNFLSMEDCELVCQLGVLKNPCASGTPLTDDSSGEAIVCGGEEHCPTGYFCHVGGAPETTNCCPVTSKRKVCDLPLAPGEGNERLERWYFDSEAQTCQSFVYAGLKGNANNFLSETACREICPDSNPCLVGRPLTVSDKYGTTNVLASCRAEQHLTSCPTHTHFCHVGTPETGNVCCTRSALDACELPVNYGVGDASLKRWYHNPMHGKCVSFRYGGARGNENNFLSRDACERTCPSYRKYCPHGSPLLDRQDNGLVSCGITKSCPQGYLCHMNSQFNVAVCCEDPGNFCLHARDAGPCEGAERRFGYNSLTDTCIPYTYGGCGGTLNNFESMERCTEICCREYRHRKFALAMHDSVAANDTKVLASDRNNTTDF